MIALLLGAVTLLVVMSALGMFSRAQISTIKSFGLWFAGIAGLLLAALMMFAGKEVGGVAVLAVLGPLLWSFRVKRPAPRPGTRRPAPRAGAMTREEAFAVLGLAPGADRAAIQAAYVRLMQAAHPDRGGSDWIAARINQARDVLLR